MNSNKLTELMGMLASMAEFPAPVSWDEIANGMSENERMSIAEAMERAGIHLIRFARYMEQRGGFGCGDQGHDAAVKRQNKLAERVRRVLGYSYPKNDITF